MLPGVLGTSPGPAPEQVASLADAAPAVAAAAAKIEKKESVDARTSVSNSS